MSAPSFFGRGGGGGGGEGIPMRTCHILLEKINHVHVCMYIWNWLHAKVMCLNPRRYWNTES